MAYQNSNPFYGSSGGGDQRRLALDNLIRRELKVGDPNDPKQIAEALLNRFKDDPRAGAITQEAKGLPFLQAMSMNPAVAAIASSSYADLQQAKDDVERDLLELATNTLLKDITPEIQGWTQAIRSAITEGANAACFGLDPRQRDKVFSIRRLLGQYARMARLVGALTPAMSLTYRKLAQSIDEVTSILLVMVGEAMANAGFGGNRFLLQVPYSDLQSRRDSTINALRNLVGTAPESFSQDTYAWGVHDYRNLIRMLEDNGQGDLRILLNEMELARIMDDMIQRAARGSVEGLRQLGATVQLDLERFLRFIRIADQVTQSNSSALFGFMDNLSLFVESFNPAGGFRLLRIARPPILFYGLYGLGNMDFADQRILQLTINRTLLADDLDDYLSTDSDQDAVIFQVILDRVLYDLDRAIDLYAVGQQDFGICEQRAAVYGYVIAALGVFIDSRRNDLAGRRQDIFDRILERLFNLITLLLPPEGPVGQIPNNFLNNRNLWGSEANNFWNQAVPTSSILSVNSLRLGFHRQPNDDLKRVLQEELNAQRQQEDELQNLVRVMAPSRVRPETVFTEMLIVLSNALNFVS
jgi:hypothetical protein